MSYASMFGGIIYVLYIRSETDQGLRSEIIGYAAVFFIFSLMAYSILDRISYINKQRKSNKTRIKAEIAN